ncbi:MAG: imidazolonepropionase [Tissierellia bacterium]|nr:imidazolonepropionase [Tissierellia bacterium]
MKDIVIVHAEQLVTPTGKTKRCGKEMNELQVIEDAAVFIQDGRIAAVGPTEEVIKGIDLDRTDQIDAKGKTILPGFVDCHTHFVFGGYRDNEYNMRLEGATYVEIMEAGGGIKSTVKATREASFEELYEAGRKRLNSMLSYGVTTVEGKSGYGLDINTENKQLDVMAKLDQDHPMDVVRTYMGAHDIPEEYKGREGDYIDFLIAEGLPAAKGKAEFADIFTEQGVFSVEESRRYLQAAKDMGYGLKVHADEIVRIGGAELAGEMGAISAEHLLKASDEGIQKMIEAGVVCALLPSTAFSLQEDYARGRYMIDQGAAVALGSDFNPGSCHTNSIPLMIALATIYMKMTVEETITALTLNGAAAIGRADQVGSLEVGKKGDVILLDAPAYKHLSYTIAVNTVEKVIKEGMLVYDKTCAYI